MKIGIFGGAFNPVHNGHLHLIDTLCDTPLAPDNTPVERMLIIPTADPPHRTGADFAPGEDRIRMLRLALTNPKAEICDIEFRLPGKSYTFNTVTALRELYPEDSFYLFMGTDQLLHFNEWYRCDELAQMAQIVAFPREDGDMPRIAQFIAENPSLHAAAVTAVPYEMSSTRIRAAVKNGEDIRRIVPPAVANYVKEHRLYE